MYLLDIIIDKHYAGFNPLQFGCEDCKPLWSCGPAVRSFWLLHYVVSGTGIFEREGNTYTVKAGDIFVIPPFVETFYQADEHDPWRYIWIGFRADSLPEEVLSHAVIHRPDAESIFWEMSHCLEKENGKSAYLSSKIWELFSLLLEDLPTASTIVDKAIHFMNAEYAGGINVTAVAKKLNVDRTYFSALFKKTVGVSPMEYLTDLRLRKAAQLMTVHGQPPLIAATSVGYFDYSHFSRTFKKRFGCSPRQFSKKT